MNSNHELACLLVGRSHFISFSFFSFFSKPASIHAPKRHHFHFIEPSERDYLMTKTMNERKKNKSTKMCGEISETKELGVFYSLTDWKLEEGEIKCVNKLMELLDGIGVWRVWMAKKTSCFFSLSLAFCFCEQIDGLCDDSWVGLMVIKLSCITWRRSQLQVQECEPMDGRTGGLQVFGVQADETRDIPENRLLGFN